MAKPSEELKSLPFVLEEILKQRIDNNALLKPTNLHFSSQKEGFNYPILSA